MLLELLKKLESRQYEPECLRPAYQVLPQISQAGIGSDTVKNHLLKDPVHEHATALSAARNYALRDLQRLEVLQAVGDEIYSPTASLESRVRSNTKRRRSHT